MISKKKFFLLLIVLSITPFFRGCDFTLGFPFPAFKLIPPDWPNINPSYLPFSVRLVMFILFSITNISIVYLMMTIILKKVKSTDWIISFYAVLVANIFFSWSYLILMFTGNTKKPVITSYMDFIAHYLYFVPYFIYDKIESVFKFKHISVLDIATRIWFVIITLILTFFSYFILKKIKKKVLAFGLIIVLMALLAVSIMVTSFIYRIRRTVQKEIMPALSEYLQADTAQKIRKKESKQPNTGSSFSTVYLKSGSTMKGVILEGNEKEIFLETDSGKNLVVLPLNEIDRIERNKPTVSLQHETDTVYDNKDIGIKIVGPAGWYKYSAEELAKLDEIKKEAESRLPEKAKSADYPFRTVAVEFTKYPLGKVYPNAIVSLEIIDMLGAPEELNTPI